MKSPLPVLAIVRTQLRQRRILLMLAVLIALLVTVVPRLVAFAHLFGIFGGHAGTRISQSEIALRHNSTTTPTPDAAARTPVVPRIIHQIFHNWKDPHDNTLPAHWQAARESCIRLNPDWDIKLWATEDSRNFIEDNYPWFLQTYDSYQLPIQKIDVLRYFILRHFGGIYLDLDNGCAANLDPLTDYPAFTTDGGKGALSNNIMGGQPDHPYWHLLTVNLIPYKWNWVLPYVIVSYQSGQWFVTAMWEKYHSLLSSDGTVAGFRGSHYQPLHRILMVEPPRPDDPWVFFTQTAGGTWTDWDSAMFHWIGDNIVPVVLAVVAVVVLLGWGCRSACAGRGGGRGKKGGYQPLARFETGELASP